MNYEQRHRRLISGQSAGLGAGFLRFLLAIAATGYSFVVRLRNILYSKGWLKAHHVDAVVICIGNITTGGTGKTPLVVWVYEQIISNLKSQTPDSPCAILTRGYKAVKDTRSKTQEYSDEIAILTESCSKAKVVVNPDRVAGATRAINEFGVTVLIMDDGFQHRRLARDLDIVTIDATQPFGYDKILPAGLLREPIPSLKRAGAVVITRCDQIAEGDLNTLENRLRSVHPDIIIVRSIHAPVRVKSANHNNISIEQLRGKKVFAFCGIGNPEAFYDTLRSLGCELIGSKTYNDHYHYTNEGLSDIYSQAERLRADLILTTQKDWTKISQLIPVPQNILFAYLAIEIQFLAGKDQLSALIEDTLQGKITKRPE